jgi:hypothetical protein
VDLELKLGEGGIFLKVQKDNTQLRNNKNKLLIQIKML